MSKTMTQDSKLWHETGRDGLLESLGRPHKAGSIEAPSLCATLLVGDCDHTNLNAAGDRCLGCGMWAHQFVTVRL